MTLSATTSPVEAVEWVFEARNDSRGGVVAKTVEADMTSIPYRRWATVSCGSFDKAWPMACKEDIKQGHKGIRKPVTYEVCLRW